MQPYLACLSSSLHPLFSSKLWRALQNVNSLPILAQNLVCLLFIPNLPIIGVLLSTLYPNQSAGHKAPVGDTGDSV